MLHVAVQNLQRLDWNDGTGNCCNKWESKKELTEADGAAVEVAMETNALHLPDFTANSNTRGSRCSMEAAVATTAPHLADLSAIPITSG
jgi:hypothetical protein